MTDKSLPPEVKPGCYINAFLLKLFPFICHCWIIIYYKKEHEQGYSLLYLRTFYFQRKSVQLKNNLGKNNI